MQLTNFEALVLSYAKAKAALRFSNSGPEHAAVVIEALLKNAQKSISLYSGNFNEKFYLESGVASAFNASIQRLSGKCQILVDDDSDLTSNKAALALVSTAGSKIEFYKRTPKSPDRINNHFMVVDNQAYRFETDDVEKKATCNFYEPEIAIGLTQRFEAMRGYDAKKISILTSMAVIDCAALAGGH